MIVFLEGLIGQTIRLVFDIAPARSRTMPEFLQREWAPRARLQQLEAISVNGLAGATGWTEARSDAGPVTLRLLGLRRDRSSAYRMMFIAPAGRMGALEPEFKRTAFSFRRLSAQEALEIRPLRLRIRPASADYRVARLARPLPYGALNDAWFRTLNDMQAGSEPLPKQTLKVFST